MMHVWYSSVQIEGGKEGGRGREREGKEKVGEEKGREGKEKGKR